MIVKVKVLPNSSKSGIEHRSDVLVIKTRSKAEAGKANAEALELLARHFKVLVSKLKILKGSRSKNKIIKIGEG
ncbi:MAG TPA: DUF167 domain-containing protein [Candidatus Colwellbacteria bacterium]|nr:DUF167 domain-containing protein [Candidatus Colwellbacteria bacterium]HQA95752.1 DUF167 domain-containing protein [Candidatus Colwellbacteria bacterium]